MKDHDEVNAMVFVNYEYMYLVVLQLFTMKKIRNEVRWYA